MNMKAYAAHGFIARRRGMMRGGARYGGGCFEEGLHEVPTLAEHVQEPNYSTGRTAKEKSCDINKSSWKPVVASAAKKA